MIKIVISMYQKWLPGRILMEYSIMFMPYSGPKEKHGLETLVRPEIHSQSNNFLSCHSLKSLVRI